MAVALITAAPCFMIRGKVMASLTQGTPVGKLITTAARGFGNQFTVNISSDQMRSFFGAVRLVAIRAGKDVVIRIFIG
jgi:hypothetical protein